MVDVRVLVHACRSGFFHSPYLFGECSVKVDADQLAYGVDVLSFLPIVQCSVRGRGRCVHAQVCSSFKSYYCLEVLLPNVNITYVFALCHATTQSCRAVNSI